MELTGLSPNGDALACLHLPGHPTVPSLYSDLDAEIVSSVNLVQRSTDTVPERMRYVLVILFRVWLTQEGMVQGFARSHAAGRIGFHRLFEEFEGNVYFRRVPVRF